MEEGLSGQLQRQLQVWILKQTSLTKSSGLFPEAQEGRAGSSPSPLTGLGLTVTVHLGP